MMGDYNYKQKFWWPSYYVFFDGVLDKEPILSRASKFPQLILFLCWYPKLCRPLLTDIFPTDSKKTWSEATAQPFSFHVAKGRDMKSGPVWKWPGPQGASQSWYNGHNLENNLFIKKNKIQPWASTLYFKDHDGGYIKFCILELCFFSPKNKCQKRGHWSPAPASPSVLSKPCWTSNKASKEG